MHLRSFGAPATLKFKRGLNLIVGANGSGKSNTIDALLFALAQEPATLRVRAFSELANRQRAGPCAGSAYAPRASARRVPLVPRSIGVEPTDA